jgi:hypothetical protein
LRASSEAERQSVCACSELVERRRRNDSGLVARQGDGAQPAVVQVDVHDPRRDSQDSERYRYAPFQREPNEIERNALRVQPHERRAGALVSRNVLKRPNRVISARVHGGGSEIQEKPFVIDVTARQTPEKTRRHRRLSVGGPIRQVRRWDRLSARFGGSISPALGAADGERQHADDERTLHCGFVGPSLVRRALRTAID